MNRCISLARTSRRLGSNQREEEEEEEGEGEEQTMERDKETSATRRPGVNCSKRVVRKTSRLRNNKVSFPAHWKTSLSLSLSSSREQLNSRLPFVPPVRDCLWLLAGIPIKCQVTLIFCKLASSNFTCPLTRPFVFHLCRNLSSLPYVVITWRNLWRSFVSLWVHLAIQPIAFKVRAQSLIALP